MISAGGSNHDTSDGRNTHLLSNFAFQIIQSVLVKRKRLNANCRSKLHTQKKWLRQYRWKNSDGSKFSSWMFMKIENNKRKAIENKWNKRLGFLTSYGAELTQVTKTKLHPASHTLDREKCQTTEQKVFHHAKLQVFSLVRNLHVSVLSATPIFEAIAQLPCLNWIFFQHPLQLDELMHFRVPPTLWIACVYCIWTVINITPYLFVTFLQQKVNGFNAALHSLDMAKTG